LIQPGRKHLPEAVIGDENRAKPARKKKAAYDEFAIRRLWFSIPKGA
jgi:hypothetical protein